MGDLEIEDQQAYIKICIDPHLLDKISEGIQANTPIFGDDGIITLVKDEFETKYPLTTRRADYFKLEHTEGQPMSAFYSKMMKMAKEAELGGLTIDDIHVYRIISTCKDKKLREEFLKLDVPTLAELNRIIKAYERRNYSAEAFDKQDNAVKQLYPKTNTKPGGDAKTIKPCFGCGANHMKQNCPHLETTCN